MRLTKNMRRLQANKAQQCTCTLDDGSTPVKTIELQGVIGVCGNCFLSVGLFTGPRGPQRVIRASGGVGLLQAFVPCLGGTRGGGAKVEGFKPCYEGKV